MKEVDNIDREIERLEDLIDKIKNIRDFAYDNPDVLICSESYFHNHLGVPGEAGQMVFVVSDELADFIWNK